MNFLYNVINTHVRAESILSSLFFCDLSRLYIPWSNTSLVPSRIKTQYTRRICQRPLNRQLRLHSISFYHTYLSYWIYVCRCRRHVRIGLLFIIIMIDCYGTLSFVKRKKPVFAEYLGDKRIVSKIKQSDSKQRKFDNTYFVTFASNKTTERL